MMLTKEGARLQVLLDLRFHHAVRSGPWELVIVDEETIEREWGWVFFYTTRGCRNGDLRYQVCGNAPIIVNRLDGALRRTGTAQDIEYYIERYEAELERKRGAWELAILEPSDCPLATLSRLRLALGISVAESGTLRKRLPCVYRVGARIDLEPTLALLVAAGIAAEIRPSPV